MRKTVSVSSNPLTLKRKYLREGLALLAEIVYIIYMKERIARAMVAERERFDSSTSYAVAVRSKGC